MRRKRVAPSMLIPMKNLRIKSENGKRKSIKEVMLVMVILMKCQKKGVKK
jgi:hypothetical protein